MSNEDRIRFSFLLIITVIVFTLTVQIHHANRRGPRELDSLSDAYLTSTARQWADASEADAQQYQAGPEIQ